MNVVPFPSLLSTLMVALCFSAIVWQIVETDLEPLRAAVAKAIALLDNTLQKNDET